MKNGVEKVILNVQHSEKNMSKNHGLMNNSLFKKWYGCQVQIEKAFQGMCGMGAQKCGFIICVTHNILQRLLYYKGVNT
jgi:hypothetical protein